MYIQFFIKVLTECSLHQKHTFKVQSCITYLPLSVHSCFSSLHSSRLLACYIHTFLTFCLLPTVPCAPANPRTIHDCSSNVIVFSWQPTNNTFYYVATAEDITGKVKECRTADNSCYFTNTGCGQFYKYNVYAVSHCKSEVSQPEFVRTCE